MKPRLLIFIIIVLALLPSTVTALGIQKAEFFDVEQDDTYDITIYVYTSYLDFKNDYTIEMEGEIVSWLDVTPINFTLEEGEQNQPITLTLTVPKDAKLGDYTGTLTAVGHRTVPTGNKSSSSGTGVGYTVATRSQIHAKVIKPGAKEIVAIEDIVAPGKVSPGEIAVFSAVIRNTGNVPTTAVLTLTIQQGSNKIAEVPSAPLDLAVGDIEEIELFWKPAAEGNYQAVLTADYGSKTTNSEPMSIAVGGSSLPGVQTFVVIIIILGAAVLLRRRS